MDDLQATLQERGKTHGDFRENSKIAEGCIAIFEASTNWSRLTDSMRQTLRMDVHKIGRILSGNPFEPDHWRDKAGYNTLIVNQLNETAKTAAEDRAHEVSTKAAEAEARASIEKDEGQRTDLRDGGVSVPTTFSFIKVAYNGVTFYIVARSAYKEEEVSHLSRIPISATHAEFTALPPYYQGLYLVGERTDGRRVLIKNYHERWGK